MAVSSTESTIGGADRLQRSVGNVSGLAPSQVWGAGSGHCGKSSKCLKRFRVGSLNVNTLRGRVCEVMETLSRRRIDVGCVQETGYRGGQCRTIKGKDSKYKLFWSGNDNGMAGMGVFLAEEWIEKVFEVQRVSDRIILVKLVVGQRVLMTVKIPASDFLIPYGDWNDHVGSIGTGFREVHGGLGYGRPDPDTEGERILDYAQAFDLVVGNTCFKKRDSHLVTYESGGAATQIDFILFRRNMRKLVTDVKVIPGEELALQHQLLVCDILIDMPTKAKHKFIPRLKV
ncbi:uncharacterized protein LOC125662874 [Ostrea edulis]|uniref:uncharacterized protein LOC125662874 n=1 Tax=Ostrea edulis TaxID=37623 RepID=UPI0024AEEA96|nr:uncharacterized protein LOC125662874 [Ostrea edulis]